MLFILISRVFQRVCFLLLIIAAIFTANNCFSQQDAQFSHYMFLSTYINPAAVGLDNTTQFTGVYRNQWTGLTTSDSRDNKMVSPQSFVLTGSTRLRQINSGVGLYVLSDWIGPLSTQNIKLSYAYHFDLTEQLKLSFGVRVGYIRQFIETGLWRVADINNDITKDPRLAYIQANQDIPNTSNFDAGGGLWLSHPKFFAGISASHITNPTYLSQANYTRSKIYTHYFIMGGYHFRLNENFILTPSAIFRDVATAGALFKAIQFDVSALINYQNNRFWGGLSYRHLDAMVALVGVGLLKDHSLRVGYAFDLNVINNAAKAFTSHEILVSYAKPLAELVPRPIIRTPRFRY